MSVQINMHTDPDYINGVLDIAPKNYQESRSEVRHFDYSPSRGFTVAQVCMILKSEKFDRYTFTGGGVGCRYWNLILILRLETCQLMPLGTALDLHSQLPFQFSTLRNDTLPWPIVQGTFDKREMQSQAVSLWSMMRKQLNDKIAAGQNVINLFDEAAGPNTEHTRKAEIGAELMGMGIDPRTIRSQIAGRKSEVEKWKGQLEDIDTTTEQGKELAEERKDEEEEDTEDEEDDD